MKNKRVITIIILLITVLIILGIIFTTNKIDKDKKIREKEAIEEKLNNIKSHYSDTVITNKETKLYKKENDDYIEFGNISKEISLNLDKENITLNTKYFHIVDMDLYINYNDVTPTHKKENNNRYENYIYFNKNIITKEKTSFYDVNNNYLFTLNQSFDFKVLVSDNERYGVVYNNELLYVKTEDVANIYDNDNGQSNKNKIRTLTYHFIYNPETTQCTESICFTLSQFESHLKYIRENDYFTLKLDELEMYLDGKINIPEKSIVLTIDDGTTLDQGALTLLEKYSVNATLFVITAWVDPSAYKSKYLDLESHTDNMHNQYECKGYGMQGGGILCLPDEKVLEDLKTSQDKLGGSKYFAYPFFDFNDRAISLLKQSGFKLAFIGQYDTDGYSYPKKTDKYKVRRTTIFSDVNMEEFKYYLQ